MLPGLPILSLLLEKFRWGRCQAQMHLLSLARGEGQSRIEVLILTSHNSHSFGSRRNQGRSEMLVLSRKVGQRIRIGKDVTITVVRITGGGVRLGIDAPTELPVIREELLAELDEADVSAADIVIPSDRSNVEPPVIETAINPSKAGDV